MQNLSVCCFGEVLWDIFPNQKKIGGAPLNVAVRLKSFQNNVSIISRIGDDELGEHLKEFISAKGLVIDYIQQDKKFKTGDVKVTLDNTGSAKYEIVYPRAWDNIELTAENIKIVKESTIFVFGSLVCRNSISRYTLLELLKTSNYNVFDVNLRPPHYNFDVLIQLMKASNFIKFNEEELFEISGYLGFKKNNIEDCMKFISKKVNTQNICVTKGKDGAVLLYNENLFYNNGYSVKVKDTVGAGDSFLATLINYLFKGDNPQNALDKSCAIGAIVASFEGANPEINSQELIDFLESKNNNN